MRDGGGKMGTGSGAEEKAVMWGGKAFVRRISTSWEGVVVVRIEAREV